MFERILFPTDGSEAALDAADLLARSLKSSPATRVTVLVVTAPTDPESSDLSPDLVEHRNASLRRTAQRALDATAARLARGGIAYATRILEGDPVSKVIADESRHGYDLIAIGSRGMGMSEEDHHYLGSVAERVIRRAGLPVLVFPSTPRSESGPVQ
ncbi:MAG: universal stress protein [Armatimonadota bacterium]